VAEGWMHTIIDAHELDEGALALVTELATGRGLFIGRCPYSELAPRF
jgi:hypothetical protein